MELAVPSPAPTQLSRRTLLALAGGTLAASACTRAPGSVPASLVIFAASSLQDALERFHQSRAEEPSVETVFAGSSQLARQIEQGAPADLFVSADLHWMDWLQARGLVDVAGRRNIARNRLALVAPVGEGAAPVDLAPGPGLAGRLLDRLGDGRLAMAQPEVPAGRYGREALTSLGVWSQLEPRLAPTENVRAALTLVAHGEAPLGLVYATDARAEDRVATVAHVAPELHSPIVYPAAPVGQATIRRPAAIAYLNDLAGPRGQAVLGELGFAAP